MDLAPWLAEFSGSGKGSGLEWLQGPSISSGELQFGLPPLILPLLENDLLVVGKNAYFAVVGRTASTDESSWGATLVLAVLLVQQVPGF